MRTSTARTTPSLRGINRPLAATLVGTSEDLALGQESPLSNHHDLRSHTKVAGCEYNQQSRQTRTCPGEIYGAHNGDLDQTATPRGLWGMVMYVAQSMT